MPPGPGAKMNDEVVGIDIHIVLVPTPAGPVPTPLPHPFTGKLLENLSPNVFIGGLAAATVGSIAINSPAHIPEGGTFLNPPTNEGIVMMGSLTVLINGKPAARTGDPVLTCNDPVPAPTSAIVAVSTVIIGG